MTVTAQQIQKVRDAGLANPTLIASAANRTGCYFYLAVAMIEKESRGHNVYGHDKGGALSGFPLAVNRGNFEVFRWLVFTKGQTSNGVGPAQLTYKGFFTEMEKNGLKPWDAKDNIYYGVGLLWSYFRHAISAGKGKHDAIRFAGLKYNGAAAYGDDLLTVALRWKDRLGNADYAS